MKELMLQAAGNENIETLRQILTDGAQRKLQYGEAVWGDSWTTEEVEAYMKIGTPYLVAEDKTTVGCA